MIFLFFVLSFFSFQFCVLEKAMPYVQIVRAFSSSVIALCKRLRQIPFDVDELFGFFTTFFFFAECETCTFSLIRT